MKNAKLNLSERLLDFGASIVRLFTKLNKTVVGRHIGSQLMQAATSSGANYEEACGAESKADFIHKTTRVKRVTRVIILVEIDRKSEIGLKRDLTAIVE